MFARISGVYDFLNHALSLGIDRYWRKELAKLAAPCKNGKVLDLAAGTFDVALAINKNYPQTQIFAMDFCLPMLAKGLKKLEKSDAEILPCCADALYLPCRQNTFDCITMAFGIRNIKDRARAFKQMLNALKPGGKACILEFGSAREKIWLGAYNFYLAGILPQIAKLAAGNKEAYVYLAKTIKEFPGAAVLEEEMQTAGFKNTGWKRLTSGIACLHWGHKPE